jgi:hypothetical protein
MGPLKLLEEKKLDSSVLEKTLAALLLYEDPKDLEWTAAKKELGFAGLLKKKAGIDPVSPLGKRVIAYAEHPETIFR